MCASVSCATDEDGQYFRDAPQTSFRSRLEGWNRICSDANCTGPQDLHMDHMHNNVHDWVRKQMDNIPSSVNHPIFNLHHCNVDRIFESWMQRFAQGHTSPELLPAYVTASGGHPEHNCDDFLVPFLSLITEGGQYRVTIEWSYIYDATTSQIISPIAAVTTAQFAMRIQHVLIANTTRLVLHLM